MLQVQGSVLIDFSYSVLSFCHFMFIFSLFFIWFVCFCFGFYVYAFKINSSWNQWFLEWFQLNSLLVRKSQAWVPYLAIMYFKNIKYIVFYFGQNHWTIAFSLWILFLQHPLWIWKYSRNLYLHNAYALLAAGLHSLKLCLWELSPLFCLMPCKFWMLTVSKSYSYSNSFFVKGSQYVCDIILILKLIMAVSSNWTRCYLSLGILINSNIL